MNDNTQPNDQQPDDVNPSLFDAAPDGEPAKIDEWKFRTATFKAQEFALAGITFTVKETLDHVGGLEHSEHYGIVTNRLVRRGLITKTGQFVERQDKDGRMRDVRVYRGTDKLKELDLTASADGDDGPDKAA